MLLTVIRNFMTGYSLPTEGYSYSTRCIIIIIIIGMTQDPPVTELGA